jgi:hypothetical protein
VAQGIAETSENHQGVIANRQLLCETSEARLVERPARTRRGGACERPGIRRIGCELNFDFPRKRLGPVVIIFDEPIADLLIAWVANVTKESVDSLE